MSDKIYDLLTQDNDIHLSDFDFPKEDIAVCESICMRINYIRHKYQNYIDKHPDATFTSDEALWNFYKRLKMITPPFLIEGL